MTPLSLVRCLIARGFWSVAFLCALVAGASAQDMPPEGVEWLVGVGAGASRTATYDASASPLRYAGVAAPLQIDLTRRSARSRTAFHLDAASTATSNARPMTNRAGNEIYSRDEIEAGLSHVRRVAGDERQRHEVGARLGFVGASRTYDFQDGISWDLVLSLDGVYAYERALSPRQRLRAEGAVTLVGWVNRPPYFLASDELFAALYDGDGTFLSLGRVRTVDVLQQGAASLTYEHTLGSRWVASGVLGLRAMRISEPETTVTLSRVASVRLAVCL